MPLRDHFRSPVNDRHTWDSVHGMWPAMIVQDLYDILPAGYEAAPTVHPGTPLEIDIAAFETEDSRDGEDWSGSGGGGIATREAVQPTLVLEAEIPEQDEYEVRIYDAERQRQLVAAIEIVSPANKDRPDSRRSFVDKVSALLAKGVCVSIVDLVTIRHFNMYADVLERIGRSDPKLPAEVPCTYAVTIRSRRRLRKSPLLDFWYYPMELGKPLPTLPIWLDTDLSVLLPLESSYEKTCRLLHIR